MKGARTGPEHHRTAQVLLANLRDEIAGMPGTPLRTKEQQTQMIAEAQVHATLALAAAQVEAVLSRGPGDIAKEWTSAVWAMDS
jgi:hypothetical protein